MAPRASPPHPAPTGRTARVARAVAHRSCVTYQTYSERYFRNIRRVEREWEAAAKDPARTQHRWLPKMLQAELMWKEKLISTLVDVVVAYGHSVEAKNSEIAALECRLHRVKRRALLTRRP